jgi:hypothetical protein
MNRLPMIFAVLWSGTAQADAWRPLAVALDCQSWGRVDACTYVQRFIDNQDVLAAVPRARADVVVYINITQQATEDLVQLRYVPTRDDLHGTVEQIAVVDSLLGVDEQRAALEPTFLRGLTPYLLVVAPQTVSVSLAAPDTTEAEALKTTPWGTEAWGGGYGWWTEDYQNYSLWTGASLYRTTEDAQFNLNVNQDTNIQRQPPLEIEGQSISLDTQSSTTSGSILYAHNLDDKWGIGGLVRGGRSDPEGQYAGTGRAHFGVERNWFPSDDPRGNRLAATYLFGVQADAYNLTNTIGEDRAAFPTHMLILQGMVRRDRTELWVDLGARAELLQPTRRYVLGASGNVDLLLGDHLALWVSMGVTQQAIPGPADVDASSFEEVSRASYAEPLSLNSNLNLRIFWANTNGARNNRFNTARSQGATSNL